MDPNVRFVTVPRRCRYRCLANVPTRGLGLTTSNLHPRCFASPDILPVRSASLKMPTWFGAVLPDSPYSSESSEKLPSPPESTSKIRDAYETLTVNDKDPCIGMNMQATITPCEWRKRAREGFEDVCSVLSSLQSSVDIPIQAHRHWNPRHFGVLAWSCFGTTTIIDEFAFSVVIRQAADLWRNPTVEGSDRVWSAYWLVHCKSSRNKVPYLCILTLRPVRDIHRGDIVTIDRYWLGVARWQLQNYKREHNAVFHPLEGAIQGLVEVCNLMDGKYGPFKTAECRG